MILQSQPCPLVAAWSFDLQKSEDVLRKHVEFRKQQDLDNIISWQLLEVLMLYGANGICGQDYEGSPVCYHIIRGLGLKGFLRSISKQELLGSKHQSCELLLCQCEQQTQKVGTRVPRLPSYTLTAALQHCAPL
ncbi:putative SEC14-like protein 6 [Heterocephalus glaber]|uniref:SEC14-like protein 6 n=1 Tax=Heterocephalus glaber TaxID=10181 RepID=A0AAX6SW06_HETGA|nr:putative SEC14-like protein 6 [Heterocephalus glaber]